MIYLCLKMFADEVNSTFEESLGKLQEKLKW